MEVRLKLVDGPPLYGVTAIQSPDDAIQLMREFLMQLDREYVCALNMDSTGRPLSFNTVSIGDISSSIVPVQNVFKSAILQNASRLICFHSHPSGSPMPSEEDYVVTKRIVAAGNLMGIPVLDHIIVGGGTGMTYSFLEHNPDILKTVATFETMPEQPKITYDEKQNQQSIAADHHQTYLKR